MEKRKYPIGPEHYTLYEEVGQGVSASVHRALCVPFNEVVAIKILDFERDNCDLNNISREAQTMTLVDHPNVLKSHCSFVCDHNLWVVMPYMSGGSCLHILKAAHPDGFEEVVIATILREVLKGLEYLHHHGHIHRDVKAGNILIDSRGGIKLGDFGVSACMFDSGDRQRTRNTFVGTPCWMAPEVMEQLHGYDFKADIWSFGITALELAHGHAPFSKYPPMKVLLMTLQNAPPGLDYERDKKFSKSFKQMIASCLVKDPSKRPSAKRLIKHSFFKQARSSDYISRTLLEGLPDLGDRIKALKRKEEDMLAQKKIPAGQMEEMSQNEYKRGISGWNFNLEDMKAQASLIQDEDIISEKDPGGTANTSDLDHEKKLQNPLACQYSHVSDTEDNDMMQKQPSTLPNNLIKSEKSDDDASIASSTHEQQVSQTSSPHFEDNSENNSAGKPGFDVNGKIFDGMPIQSLQRKIGSLSNIILPDASVHVSKGESDKLQHPFLNFPSCCPSPLPLAVDDPPPDIAARGSRSSANSDELDEKARPVVQQRGRFKVTSENVEIEKVVPAPLLQKSHSMQVISQHTTLALSSTEPAPSNLAHSVFPSLQSVLQSNIVQRDNILSLMKQLSAGDSAANRLLDGGVMPMNTASLEKSLLETAHDREKELLNEIADLQWRLICTQEELQKYKTENAQPQSKNSVIAINMSTSGHSSGYGAGSGYASGSATTDSKESMTVFISLSGTEP
ncbi:Non-specific serine/threonine protein kinase [Bertholletia excelsa]